MASDPDTFDAAYYDRYYRSEKSQVSDKETIGRLARFVAAYLDAIDVPVKSVLDIGCGLGWWQRALRHALPRSHRYTGVEFSDYLVDELGWEHGSVVDYASERPFDLVICQGVLQYLPNRAAGEAIENLGRLTGKALFLEALTTGDWERNVDRKRTDGNVHLRTVKWYRQRLRPTFYECGGGLFVRRDLGLSLFDLEHFG